MAKIRRNRATRSNGIRYTDKQKLVAVETVRAAGGQVSEKTLADVRLVLASPTLSLSTLDTWVKKARLDTTGALANSDSRKNGSAPQSTIAPFDPKATARDMWRQTRIRYLQRANEASSMVWVDGKDAVIAAERAQKMEQLLDGLPTEIVGVIPDLLQTIRKKGYDPLAAFQTLKSQFEALPDAPMVTTSHGAN